MFKPSYTKENVPGSVNFEGPFYSKMLEGLTADIVAQGFNNKNTKFHQLLSVMIEDMYSKKDQLKFVSDLFEDKTFINDLKSSNFETYPLLGEKLEGMYQDIIEKI